MRVGDWVTVTVPGRWFCFHGQITARRKWARRRWQVGPSGWWATHELTTEPADRM